MKNSHFSDHAAGAKTLWVIDFKDHSQETGQKRDFDIYTTPSTPPKDTSLLDIEALEKIKDNYSEFLSAMAKLCSLLEKDYGEGIKDIEITEKEAKSVDTSLGFLGDIVKKFNEMLRRMRKKDDQDPPKAT